MKNCLKSSMCSKGARLGKMSDRTNETLVSEVEVKIIASSPRTSSSIVHRHWVFVERHGDCISMSESQKQVRVLTNAPATVFLRAPTNINEEPENA